MRATGSYTSGLLKLCLDSKHQNYQLLASAMSGEIKTENRSETIYKFSDADLKFIKECVCICYYRTLSK